MKNKLYVTIQDIARLAGVSKSTVSRYLNGGSVSQKTRLKLEAIIKEYDYQPNAFAQSLKAKKTNLIGIIVPRLNSYSVHESLKGMECLLRERGYETIIVNTYQSKEQELTALKTLAQQKVAGIIFYGTVVSELHRELIKKLSLPVVVLGQRVADVPHVIYQDYEAGLMMGRYIKKMGHQKLLYFGVDQSDQAIGIERKKGVFDGLAVSPGEVCQVMTGFSIQQAYHDAMKYLIADSYTCAICATDNIALGVLKAARNIGILVPQELSITGFGGYAMGTAVFPSITTIDYDFEKGGRVTAEQLLAVIQNQPIDQEVSISCQLEIRESTLKQRC